MILFRNRKTKKMLFTVVVADFGSRRKLGWCGEEFRRRVEEAAD